MLTVKDIMQKDVVTVSPDTTARYLAKVLADEEITGVPVIDANDALVGVVSSTDLVRLAADESGVEVRSVGLAREVDPVLDPDAIDDDGIHRAVVIDGGRLLGIVTSADVLRAVAEERVAIGA